MYIYICVYLYATHTVYSILIGKEVLKVLLSANNIFLSSQGVAREFAIESFCSTKFIFHICVGLHCVSQNLL